MKQTPTGTQPVTIRIEAADVASAKKLAKRKGLKYQTLIKTLLHEALKEQAA